MRLAVVSAVSAVAVAALASGCGGAGAITRTLPTVNNTLPSGPVGPVSTETMLWAVSHRANNGRSASLTTTTASRPAVARISDSIGTSSSEPRSTMSACGMRA